MTIEDECGICFAALSVAPCLRVCKSHVFHASCIRALIESRWTTMSVNFSHLNCPTCKEPMKIHSKTPVIGPLFSSELQFMNSMKKLAMKEAYLLKNSERLSDPTD